MAPSPIRPAQLADLPQLAALMIEFYGESDYPLTAAQATRAFEPLLRDPRLGQVWLADHDGEPAGYVVLTVGYSMEYAGLRGFVDDFFIRKAHRGRGLGAAALDEVKRACAERGVRALLVEVGPDNETAKRVYRRAGLVEDGGRVLMSMPLAAPTHET